MAKTPVTTIKKLEGFLEDQTPTTIQVDGKTIYLPIEKREEFKAKEFKGGDAIQVFYDRTGNLIKAEHIGEKDKQPLSKALAPIIDADGEQQKKLHMQKDEEAASGVGNRMGERVSTETPAAGSQSQNVHIQKDNLKDVAPRMWMGDQEKNDYIILQSVLARATEIVNANYTDFPQLVKKGSGIVHEPDDFVDVLEARCNLIEIISDRLFEYVKKKVRDESERLAKDQTSGSIHESKR